MLSRLLLQRILLGHGRDSPLQLSDHLVHDTQDLLHGPRRERELARNDLHSLL